MWELDQHMHSYIAPSVAAYAQRQSDPLYWLEATLREQLADPDFDLDNEPVLGTDELANRIAEQAIVYGGTTNGGHEVYLHAWCSVPWCNEDTYQQWYG